MDQFQGPQGAVVQIPRPDGTGLLNGLSVTAHEEHHPRLAHLADAGEELVQNAVRRLAGNEDDILGLGVGLQSVDAHEHGNAAHRLFQVVAARADGLAYAASRLVEDGRHMLDAGAGGAHDTEGAAIVDA